MYLWNVDSLVDDFKSGKVSQQEEFKYMLLFSIVTSIVSDPILYINASYNYYDTLRSFLILGVSIVGLYTCYKINTKGDNRDFIVRVMCIGLPSMIRVLVVFIPIFFIGGILEAAFLLPELLEEEIFESTPMETIFISVFVGVYYWYLSIKIKAVSSLNA